MTNSLKQTRAHSHYAMARVLLDILTVLGILATLGFKLFAASQLVEMGSQEVASVVILMAGLQILAILVGRYVIHAVWDIADATVDRRRDLGARQSDDS